MYNAKWIAIDCNCKKSKFYNLKKTFVAKHGDNVIINVSAATRYQMYINDLLCSEGPCQGSNINGSHEIIHDCH